MWCGQKITNKIILKILKTYMIETNIFFKIKLNSLFF